MGDDANYKIWISMKNDILEIIISGALTKETIDKLHNDVIGILKKKSPKAVLCDISCLTGRFDDFADAFFRTRNLPKHVTIIPGAVVDTSDDISFISFYETTAANIGQNVKWFNDVKEARNWLKSKVKEIGKK
ncbi:MAG: hypothetical protein JW956_15085 [Calditrichaceae bacterium]|nr:hypothetical protein [Calditrichaceae bacterium]HES59976.1 STAS/SEC14 domain-containing protein [Caldithrix sp.]